MRKEINDLNSQIRNCTKCRLCETRTNAICGEGNLDAKIMLIAQAPGFKEDEKGVMFVGPSGKVLDELLESNNVKRNSLYMTNLVKCMLPDYRKPRRDEIDTCSIYLDKEIKLIDPSVLAPLGYYATRYIFKKYSLELPSSKKDFYKLYGDLFLGDSMKKILPLNHPVTVVYNPSLKETIKDDYHKLSVLSEECKWYQMCPMKRYYKQGLLDRKWVEMYCKGDWESCVRYNMEEKGEPHPDYMLPDGTIDNVLKNEV
ncbi:MAG: uracil-DNA glycosylase [Candidatus Thermoplasmatota archaeon]